MVLSVRPSTMGSLITAVLMAAVFLLVEIEPPGSTPGDLDYFHLFISSLPYGNQCP